MISLIAGQARGGQAGAHRGGPARESGPDFQPIRLCV
jgi:hypothetical protein